MFVERTEFEPREGTIFSKLIYLVHPQIASAHGINTELPVFLDRPLADDSPVDRRNKPLVFKTGDTFAAEGFICVPGLSTYSCASTENGFIALLEPIGKTEANIIASYGMIGVGSVCSQGAKVKEIRAYCMSKDKDHRGDSHYADRKEETQMGIREGFIIMGRGRERNLRPVCKEHKLYPYEIQYAFRVTDEGEVIFTKPDAMPK